MSYFSKFLLSGVSIIGLSIAGNAKSSELKSDVEIQRDIQTEDEIVIVTGTPIPKRIFLAPADIDILGGRAKERAENTGFGHTLDELPGIANISTGEQVGLPVIRGLSGNRIRVMSNNIGMYYQQYGSRHPVNIDPFLADRFEIVRGPASLQFGSDAIGGAINIISREIKIAGSGKTIFGGALHGGYSSAYESFDGGLQLDASKGNFGFTASYLKRDSDGMNTPKATSYTRGGTLHLPLFTGFIPYTDYEQENLALGAAYNIGNSEISLRYEKYLSLQNYLMPDPQGAGRLPIAGGLGQRLSNDSWQLRLKQFTKLGEWDNIISLSSNLRRANQGGNDPLPLPVRGSIYNVELQRDSFTLRSVLNHEQIYGFKGQIGLEYLKEKQWSKGTERLSPGGEIENIGLFAFEDRSIGDLTLNVGARFDHREQELKPELTYNKTNLPSGAAAEKRNYDEFTWGVGASYLINKSLVFAGNIKTAYRAPDLFDLYTRGVHGGVAAVQIGDPNLTEEKAVSADVSVRWKSNRIEGNITSYITEFDGYISLLGTGLTDAASGLPIFQISQRDARMWGFDTDLKVALAKNLDFHATYEYIRGEFTDDNSNMPYLPADNIIAELTYNIPDLSIFKSAYISFGVKHAFAKKSAGLIEPFGTYDSASPGFGTASTDDYNIAHIHTGADIGNITLKLEAENLFNEEYRDFLDTYKILTLGAGRDIRISAIVRF